MQNHYRELDIENFEDIQSRLVPYVVSQHVEKYKFWNHPDADKLFSTIPDLKDTIKKAIGQEPLSVYLLSVPNIPEALIYQRLGKETIHADTSVESCRFNWPVLNGASIETRLFTSSAEPTRHTLAEGEAYLKYQEEDCEQIASFKMTKPTILRVHTIHGLYRADGPLPRYLLSFKFDKDISHLLN